MFTKRIIPCLDVKNGRVVKGVNFVDLKDAGDPVEIAKAYDKAGADEVVFLDITASSDQRGTVVDMVRKVAANVFIPFTVGGGIRTVDHYKKLLRESPNNHTLNTTPLHNLDQLLCHQQSAAHPRRGTEIRQPMRGCSDRRQEKSGWKRLEYL